MIYLPPTSLHPCHYPLILSHYLTAFSSSTSYCPLPDFLLPVFSFLIIYSSFTSHSPFPPPHYLTTSLSTSSSMSSSSISNFLHHDFLLLQFLFFIIYARSTLSLPHHRFPLPIFLLYSPFHSLLSEVLPPFLFLITYFPSTLLPLRRYFLIIFHYLSAFSTSPFYCLLSDFLLLFFLFLII